MEANYDYWEKALADPAALHAREFRITTDPQCGFFRTRRVNEPVAIWEESGALNVMVSGYDVDPSEYETVWLNCCKYPVTEKEYHKAVTGGGWGDIDEAVAAIGDNRRRGDDAAAIIDDLAGQAAKYQEITDDEMAKRAISLRAALQEQGKKVDKVREAGKAPHLRAAREVDEIYMTTVKLAKTWADYLRHLVESWETAKRRRIREEEERRGAAEALQIPVEPDVVPAPADQIRTGYGRAASVRTRLVVTDIADFRAVVQHYREDARVWQALIAIAQQDIERGQTVPGVIVEEVAKVV